ncbi:PREDICTED: acid phosphatase 1-like [Camelina sativa]|uniref:Acid phosphatase 1-like n=1 Tax=Camelina sativa TaxID=90675 RepID=A0ABM0ZKW3_CAMSA|nr:PREDICTED: acid phosphatase 1-like [Camelina sativa]XP_010517162.1 PREDICTED: acid phosphatase 1-like [Camelina sativa]XP_010517163.1 PREDICTED: acid phosphatase 1-like [Camelina sativa]
MDHKCRRETLILIFLTISSVATSTSPWPMDENYGASYCLSWRLGVETNNVRLWRIVPLQCLRYVEVYMLAGQYDRDVQLIVDQIKFYLNEIVLPGDGMDAWILDVDDTCLSNVFYYRLKRYGCDPYDPTGFRTWSMKGECPAIQPVLELFNTLIETGFKVFLVTGRDEETLRQATQENLHNQGYTGYERLIMRTADNKRQSAITYKTRIRKEMMEQGYRIWGNVGDQWSDLQGEYSGDRTFKIPNPMYFVP